MGVIEEIFHGTLNPAEKIRSETEVYQDALAAAEKLARQLMDQLSPEQYELFETYCTEKAVMAGEMQCECYRQGVLMGVRLYRDLEL